MITTRLRRIRESGDYGYALLFVMFVTTMVLIGTATMLSATARNIVPAKNSQDDLTATAAAQSGIQDFLATLDAQCRQYSVATCPWLHTITARTPFTGSSTSGTSTLESWSVYPYNPTGYITVNAGTVRIVATGFAGNGLTGKTPLASKVLTADISGNPSVLRYTYFSNFETLGSAFLNSYYPQRTITITNTAVANAVGYPVGTTITWNGAGSVTNQNSDSVCDKLWYDSPVNAGSSGSSLGRSSLRSATLPQGTDYSETGTATTLLGAKTSVTRYAPCQVSFSSGMSFTGPVYSRDALLMSNGEWGNTTGPSFTVPSGEDLPAVSTGWSSSSTPAATTSTPYRVMPQVGGAPTTTSSSTAQLVQTTSNPLSLPSSATPSAVDCRYTGPTRITLNGSTATVTSPLTTTTGGACYTSTGSGSGVVSAKVPVGITTIEVDNSTAVSSRTPSFPDLNLGAAGDITAYSPTKGDIYVQGSLSSGRLSLVAGNDIVVTGDVTTNTTARTNVYGEQAWASGAAIALVATNNVRIYHPVSCPGLLTATNGYCPNDVSGLYTTSQAGAFVNPDGSLMSTHPALQYCNILNNGAPAASGGSQDCSTSVTAKAYPANPANREIDAAVFALNGSLMTDNFDRGRSLGTLLVKGGVYENHRGATGQQWEIPTATSVRSMSGYKLQISFLSLQQADLPYVPVLVGGNPATPWHILSVSTAGANQTGAS